MRAPSERKPSRRENPPCRIVFKRILSKEAVVGKFHLNVGTFHLTVGKLSLTVGNFHLTVGKLPLRIGKLHLIVGPKVAITPCWRLIPQSEFTL